MVSKKLRNDDPAVSLADDVDHWMTDTLQAVKPSVLVAVARGAVRFLQLHYHRPLPPGVFFCSHYATPFIPDDELEGHTVLLFDDSIIFGSTMAETKQHLENRGARVCCAAYVVDRTNFLGEDEPGAASFASRSPHSILSVRSRHKLWPQDVRRHHANLISDILSTPWHYNLDFPTFSLSIPPFSAGDVPYLAHLLRTGAGMDSLVDVSTPMSLHAEVPRYSCLAQWDLQGFLCAKGFLVRPYTKLRLTFVPRLGQIVLTPVVQLSLPNHIKYAQVHFGPPQYDNCWSNLIPPFDQSEVFYQQGLFRLITAFIGTIVGASICRRINDAVGTRLHIDKVSCEADDLKLIVGTTNGNVLSRFSSDVLSGDALPMPFAVPGQTPTVEVPNAPELRTEIAAVMQQCPQLKPEPGELTCETVGKVFLALRQVTDSPQKRRKNSLATRLEVGLTFEGIRSLLLQCAGLIHTIEDISLAIDLCVDRGLAVPKVVREGNNWLRVFYCGEDEDNQDFLQLKGALHAAYSRFLKKRKRTNKLSAFDMQKLCVALKDVVPWLPLSTSPYKFGFTGAVGEEQLIPWLTRGHRSPMTVVEEDGRDVLVPNPEYRCPVASTWQDPSKEREFNDAFHYTASAFAQLTTDAKLLLTTCRTHRHVFNAVAFEAHAWCGYKDNSFGDLLQTLEAGLPSGQIDTVAALRSMYWCIRYVSEGWKKIRIFEQEYRRLLNELRKSFHKQGEGGQRWWTFLEHKGIFDNTRDKEIEKKFVLLIPLLQLMEQLTCFVIHAAINATLVTKAELHREFTANGVSFEYDEFAWFVSSHMTTAAVQYNKSVDEHVVPGRSILTSRLLNLEADAITTANHIRRDVLPVALQCFNQLRQVLLEYCPRYNVADNDFPFSPNYQFRVLSDGSTEERHDKVFILTMDIIGGTHSRQTNDMKLLIRDVLRRFREHGVKYEDTGNDSFVAICEDSLTLWDLANSIRVKGADLRVEGDPFGGTRKGLYFGSVLSVTKSNGEVLLQDLTLSNSIPAAFYLLPGIDEHVAERERNDFLIVADNVLKLCAERLGLSPAGLSRVRLRAKHFSGYCYLLRLA